MSTVVRALLLAALLTLVPVGIGVAVSHDPTPDRLTVTYAGTELSDFDSTRAVVRRAPFCDLLPQAAVDDAVDGDAEVTAYANGEESEALPRGDVAHEYGCLFTGTGEASGTSVAAWVFAPPITTERAETLVASAAKARGCTTAADAPAFGKPSLASTCTTGDVRTVSHRGLFGDAWLTCTVTAPVGVVEADQVARAGRWCVAVAEAAATAR